MLTFCAVLVLGLSEPRAQVSYNFQTPDIAPLVVSTNAGYDDLSMDCLAANGFGQWTSSGSMENVNGAPSNFLLANAFMPFPNPPVTTGWDDVQAGVLAAKKFTFTPGDVYPTSDAIKCAANLQGNVRYVWINNNSTPGRNSFYVEGFDPGSAGIDISFSTLPSDPSIVKAPIATLGTAPLLTTSHQLVSSSNENNPLDRFDIAIDASFLYIVWEEAVSNGMGGFNYSIWTTVVSLTPGVGVMLEPTRVDPSTGTGGRRPTVSVDIRNSGTIAPFDVAYLTPVIPSLTGSVLWTQFITGTAFTPPVPLSTSFTDPQPPNPGFNWEAPTHARILTASESAASGISPSTANQRAVYIIAGTSCASSGLACMTHLFIDYIKNATPVPRCEYCDGLFNCARSSGFPVEMGSPFFFAVDDNPIIAFADPYEGANANAGMGGNDFTEFHCLYQIDRSGSFIPPSHHAANNPLMIIPGNHAAMGYCVSGGGTSSFYDDPGTNPIGFTAYCGAVNQMGIHVHWTGEPSGDHFYCRDIREFDQDIEENTLMTAECDLGNAESLVGINSPTVHSNLDITLYSDPNTSLQTGRPVWIGNLLFDGDASLNIGSSSETGADLVIAGATFGLDPIMGQAGFWTSGFSTSGSWAVNFAANNSFDDYAILEISGAGQFNLNGTGETLLSNGDVYEGQYVSNILEPVTWTIHNTLLDLNTASITATDGIFIFQGNEFSGDAGYLSTECNASYTNCQFEPDQSTVPGQASTSFDYSILVHGSGGDADYTSSSYPAPDAHTVTFTSCLVNTGIDISGNWTNRGIYPSPYVESPPPSVTIDGGLIENIGIIAGVDYSPFSFPSNHVSPWWPIYIYNAAFDQMNGQGMIVDLGYSPSDLPSSIPQTYSITLMSNYFESFTSTTGQSGYTPYSSGILIANAPDLISGTLPSSEEDNLRIAINVGDNVFLGVEHHLVDAAIHFMNCTGDIVENSIEDPLYNVGIWNESSKASNPQRTWSFICSNYIINSASAAISTDWYKGYEKLNQFGGMSEGNGNGQISGINDNGHIDMSQYEYNNGPAYIGALNSITDLAGVHHPTEPSIDEAAYNVFTNNNIYNPGGAEISLTGPTSTLYLGLAPTPVTWPIPPAPDPSPYGLNDIEGSPSISTVTAVNLFDISNNYWGSGGYSLGPGVSASGVYLAPPAPTSPGFSCSSGVDLIKKKGSTTLSTLSNDSGQNDSSCGTLFSTGYALSSDNIEPQAYDTLREFLENCPFYTNSWDAFVFIGGAVSGWTAGGAGRWPDFLSFLKQVLYLNPDTNWYCNDVSEMIEAVQSNSSEMAICQYIIQSGKCPGLASAFQSEFNAASYWRHYYWRDSVEQKYAYIDSTLTIQNIDAYNDSVNADTLANPYDTSAPTLWQDSLDVLLGPQYAEGVQPSSPITSQALLSAQLLENPMQDEIAVSYQMGRTALVTMELRDVLGRSVPIANAKYQLEQPGDHTATIPAPNLPPGIYYLRITTDVGDAITLKIVKE